ncbi:MAG: hypothetical protein LM558_00060 [Thermosphaera sp.]|nr:hypothetical protein [Thermosphaera sp.]
MFLFDSEWKEIGRFTDESLDKIRIVFYGNGEARNIIEALDFASKALKSQYKLNSRTSKVAKIEQIWAEEEGGNE